MMKLKFGGILLALALAANVSFGGDLKEMDAEKRVKELEKVIEDQGIYVETAKKGIVLSGYVDASYSYNFNGGGTDSGINGTPGPIRTHQFDVDSNDFNINQVKIALEKALPEENTWAAGFRIDLMFGEDAKYLGDNDAGDFADDFALEQAYVQFRVPVGNGLDVKFGKFVTLLGYEVIETPANLNVSRSYAFTFGIPLFHTGFLMAYKFNDIIDVKLGLVNGWNNSDSNYLDGVGNGGENGTSAPGDFAKAITAQIAIHAPGGNADLVNSFIYSFEGEAAIGIPDDADEQDGIEGDELTENEGVFVWDIWGQWKPKAFNDKLLLAFNAGIGKAYGNYRYGIRNDNGDIVGYGDNTDTWWYGALYAKYQFSKVFSVATRGEYFHDGDGTARIQDLAENFVDNENFNDMDWRGAFYANPTDMWSWTVTLGFDIWENLLARLEYRLDVASSDGGNALERGPRNEDGVEQNVFTNNDSTQHTLILDFSYSF